MPFQNWSLLTGFLSDQEEVDPYINCFLRYDATTKQVDGIFEISTSGVANFAVNLLSAAGYNGADNLLPGGPGFFTDGGVLATAFSRFTNPYSSDYDPSIGWLNLWYDNGQGSITLLNLSGVPVMNLSSTFVAKDISDPSCFNEGTKILCLNKNFEEEYIPIENLRKGDLVKSYKHGYRKIDLIGKNYMANNPEKFSECMYKMEKTNENGLLEDLIITGWHSILVDDLKEDKEQNKILFGSPTQMIDDKYLLLCSVSKDFVKLENTDLYTYYHFILANNDNDEERFGVWANGILTETPSKKEFLTHNYILL